MTPQQKNILAVTLSILLMAIALNDADGHLGSILQFTSALIYFGAMLSMAGMILGPKTLPTLKYIFFRRPSSFSPRQMIAAVTIFEKTSFTAGLISGALGLFHAGINSVQPWLIGPGIAVSIIGLMYSAGFNFLFLVPAKLALLSEQEKTIAPSNWNGAFKRWMLGLLGLIAVCIGAFLEGAKLEWYVSLPGILLTWIAPMLIVLIYDPLKRNSPIYASDLCLSGAVVAMVFHVVHLMANLDVSRNIVGTAVSSGVPALYALVLGIYFRLKAEHNMAADEPKNLTYPLFVGFVIFLLFAATFAALIAVTFAA